MSGTPYDVELTPYNKIVFDFLQDPYDRELVILKSSQIGLTLAVYIGLAWTTKYNPGNLLYVARDVLSVRELGKQRLTPIMKQVSPEFSDEISGGDQTIQVKRINGITMRLIGAQSASGFISFPCSVAALDETETHADLPEGSTIALTRARFKGDSDSKLIIFSKAHREPVYETDKTTKRQRLTSGQGTRTCDEFYSGTQETYHVPCPHCGHFQPLKWEQMKLDPAAITSEPGVLPVEYDNEKVLEMTYLECMGCKGRILDHHKRKMVPQGRWTPAKPEERKGPYKTAHPRRRSIHISDLYCFIFDTVHWGKLMIKWIEAQGDYEKLDAFHNDFLGLPCLERTSAGKVELWAIDRLISNYPRLGLYDRGRRWTGGKIRLHNDPLFIGIALDRQLDHYKFVISSFMEDGEMFVLDYGALADEDDITFLLENFEAWGATDEENPYRLMAGLIDAGFLRSSVINYAFRARGIIRHFSPARGHGDVMGRRPVWVSKDISIPGEVVEVVNFDSQAWEHELNRFRIMEARPDKPSRRHPRIFLPADVTDDFREELANAHQIDVPLKHGQGTRSMWTKAKPSQSNDFADCMKMLLLVFAIWGPDPVDESQPEEPEA